MTDRERLRYTVHTMIEHLAGRDLTVAYADDLRNYAEALSFLVAALLVLEQ